jgi:diguanylate cyclase (GGDEF)-like protein
VLRMVAFVLQATLRKEDEAATFRGGALFVLAREADPVGVQRLAGRIRQAVERSGFVVGSTEHGVTVSVGVATLAKVPAQGLGAAGARLLEAAATALGQAQQRGKGQVVVHRLPPAGR